MCFEKSKQCSFVYSYYIIRHSTYYASALAADGNGLKPKNNASFNLFKCLVSFCLKN